MEPRMDGSRSKLSRRCEEWEIIGGKSVRSVINFWRNTLPGGVAEENPTYDDDTSGIVGSGEKRMEMKFDWRVERATRRPVARGRH